MRSRSSRTTATFAVAGALAIALGACARTSGSNAADGSSGAGKSGRAACSPQALGLGNASPVAMWKPPGGCKANGYGSGPLNALQSEEQFKLAFDCPAGVTSGVDFGKHEIIVSSRTLPPAGMGTEIVDDGSKLTFINKQRNPCPGDPQPMPMTYAITFLMPAGATRDYADTVCTVDSSCR